MPGRRVEPVNTTRECWICQGKFGEDMPAVGDSYRISCTTCGIFLISASLHASAFPTADGERYRLSYWCKQRELDGRQPPVGCRQWRGTGARGPRLACGTEASLISSAGKAHAA